MASLLLLLKKKLLLMKRRMLREEIGGMLWAASGLVNQDGREGSQESGRRVCGDLVPVAKARGFHDKEQLRCLLFHPRVFLLDSLSPQAAKTECKARISK